MKTLKAIYNVVGSAAFLIVCFMTGWGQVWLWIVLPYCYPVMLAVMATAIFKRKNTALKTEPMMVLPPLMIIAGVELSTHFSDAAFDDPFLQASNLFVWAAGFGSFLFGAMIAIGLVADDWDEREPFPHDWLDFMDEVDETQ